MSSNISLVDGLKESSDMTAYRIGHGYPTVTSMSAPKGDAEYEVESIRSHHVINGKIYYWVH
jgi:hypothetical protein